MCSAGIMFGSDTAAANALMITKRELGQLILLKGVVLYLLIVDTVIIQELVIYCDFFTVS